jgi:hypothetical protein
MKHISKSQVFYISSWVGYIMNPKCSISKVKLVKLAINKYIYIIKHYTTLFHCPQQSHNHKSPGHLIWLTQKALWNWDRQLYTRGKWWFNHQKWWFDHSNMVL